RALRVTAGTSIFEGEKAKNQTFSFSETPPRRAQARGRPGGRADGAARDRQGSCATGSEGGPPCIRSVVHALPAQDSCAGGALRSRVARGRRRRAGGLHQGLSRATSFPR